MDDHRGMPTDDFYRDWAQVNFGPGVGEAVAVLFQRIDGRDLPEPCGWTHGPGTVTVNPRPWEQERSRYQFVDDLAGLRDKVQGAGNLARFDYWLNTFQYMRTMAHVGCVAGQLKQVVSQVGAEKDATQRSHLAREKALPLRRELAQLWSKMIGFQIAAVGTVGEMGTLANLEQQSRGTAALVTQHDAVLAKALGEPLPADLQPGKDYAGPPRILVPTARTSLEAGESLTLKVLLPAAKPPKTASLFWRPLGQGHFTEIPLTHVARAVYRVSLPAPSGETTALEYYVQASWDDGPTLVYPATAPRLNQTVVVHPSL